MSCRTSSSPPKKTKAIKILRLPRREASSRRRGRHRVNRAVTAKQLAYEVDMAADGPLNDIANRMVYGFNKSHAVAYGWIAYQTAYLKANHPRAYLAALMTSVKDKTDKLVEYIEEAKKLGHARCSRPT